jgi:uncharacterized protein
MKRAVSFLVAVCCLSFMPVARAAEEGISVTSSGTIQSMPDTALFEVTVRSSDKDAAKAVTRTAQGVTNLQNALRTAGIPAADSPSSGYSVRPEWVWEQSSGRNVLKGYVARHVVNVKVRELRLVGAAIDAAVRSGAGEVSDVRFVSSRFDQLRREALELAVKNAREDAGVIARAAGGRLDGLLELNSDMSQRSPVAPMDEMAFAKAAAPAPATEVVPGEMEVSVTVHSRWRFSGPAKK